MPRGARKSVEIQISEIQEAKAKYQTKIDGLKEKIAKLDSQIKALEESRKQKELEELLNVVKKSGKSPQDIIELIK